MPLLGYTKEVAGKLKAGAGQTIRPAGKRIFKPGQKLYHWTGPYKPGQRVRLGESTVSESLYITFYHDKDTLCVSKFANLSFNEILRQFNFDDFARADGFYNWQELETFFVNTYKFKRFDSKDFIVIKWVDFVPTSQVKKNIDYDVFGDSDSVPLKSVWQTTAFTMGG